MRENQKCSDSIMKLSQRTFMLKFKPCKLQQQFYRTFLLVPQNSIKMHLILFSKEKISFDNNYSWVNFISKLLRQRLISRLNKIGHDQISFFPRARVQVNHDQGWLRDWQFFCLAIFFFWKLHQIWVTVDCSVCSMALLTAARNVLISEHHRLLTNEMCLCLWKVITFLKKCAHVD